MRHETVRSGRRADRCRCTTLSEASRSRPRALVSRGLAPVARPARSMVPLRATRTPREERAEPDEQAGQDELEEDERADLEPREARMHEAREPTRRFHEQCRP